jgi:DNA-binding NarL/FixJ family response regulator
VTIRIAIADPHPIFRDGLARLLQTAAGFAVVGHTSTFASVALVRDTGADVLLFGIGQSTEAAVEPLRRLADLRLPVRTILLIDRVERSAVKTAVQLGVCAVIPRDSPKDVLFTAIRGVATEQCSQRDDPAPDAVADVRRLATSRRRSHAFGLTLRESEILCRITAGLTNREIAVKLAISENTVKAHIGHLFNKLGASNRLELALFAKHHRLLDGV